MNLNDAASDLQYVGFTHDAGYIFCGTSTGFKIFKTDPFKEIVRRTISGRGIGIIEMFLNTNIAALVGGGAAPCFPPDKVILWDDFKGEPLARLNLPSRVLAARLRHNNVVVVTKTHVYNFKISDLSLAGEFDTTANPRGLIAVSQLSLNFVMAAPGDTPGQVRVERVHERQTLKLDAHDRPLTALALSANGALLATACERGTVVHVYDAETGALLHEFKRGSRPADVASLAFNADASLLALSSDKSTVHLFALTNVPREAPVTLPGFRASSRSLVQHKIPDARSLISFCTSPNVLYVVGQRGRCYKLRFNLASGRCVQLAAGSLHRH
eukprot:gnl/Chilomastix_cuspidata/3329.p1 GENE.gnl/Chilomastix_cuspidata/3329~~gnl/Chilomastix_cuspidata/3329.p1  ORF type:complete len:338 (+),score=126.84 gnl/Chilomastix_cuspidata/3329:33-1016(+)